MHVFNKCNITGVHRAWQGGFSRVWCGKSKIKFEGDLTFIFAEVVMQKNKFAVLNAIYSISPNSETPFGEIYYEA